MGRRAREEEGGGWANRGGANAAVWPLLEKRGTRALDASEVESRARALHPLSFAPLRPYTLTVCCCLRPRAAGEGAADMVACGALFLCARACASACCAGRECGDWRAAGRKQLAGTVDDKITAPVGLGGCECEGERVCGRGQQHAKSQARRGRRKGGNERGRRKRV